MIGLKTIWIIAAASWTLLGMWSIYEHKFSEVLADFCAAMLAYQCYRYECERK